MKPQTKPNDIASKLRAAKALIATPETWCQQGVAFDRHGNRLAFADDPRATQRCAIGALEGVMGRDAFVGEYFCGAQSAPLVAAAQALGFPTPWMVNDYTDHATVMAMFDRAIALAEQEAAL